MRGGEAEREAETGERNVRTLRTDGRLEDSQLHLFIRRYDAITADVFAKKKIHVETTELVIQSVYSIQEFG